MFQWKLTQLRSSSLLLGLEFVTLKTRQYSTRDALNQHKNNSLSELLVFLQSIRQNAPAGKSQHRLIRAFSSYPKPISTISQSCSMPCLTTPLSLPHGGVLGVTGVGSVPTGGKSLCQGESSQPAAPSIFCALGVFQAAEGAGNESECIKEAPLTCQASLILGSQIEDLTVFWRETPVKMFPGHGSHLNRENLYNQTGCSEKSLAVLSPGPCLGGEWTKISLEIL